MGQRIAFFLAALALLLSSCGGGGAQAGAPAPLAPRAVTETRQNIVPSDWFDASQWCSKASLSAVLRSNPNQGWAKYSIEYPGGDEVWLNLRVGDVTSEYWIAWFQWCPPYADFTGCWNWSGPYTRDVTIPWGGEPAGWSWFMVAVPPGDNIMCTIENLELVYRN